MCFQVSRTLSFVVNTTLVAASVYEAKCATVPIGFCVRFGGGWGPKPLPPEPLASDYPYPSWRSAVAIGSAIPRSEPPGGHPLFALPPWIIVPVDLSLIFGLISGCLPLTNFGPPRVFYFPGALHIWGGFPYSAPGEAPDARLATGHGNSLPTCAPTYLPTSLSTYLLTYLYIPAYLTTYLPTYLPARLPSCLPSHLPTCWRAEWKSGFSTLQEVQEFIKISGSWMGAEWKRGGGGQGFSHLFEKKKRINNNIFTLFWGPRFARVSLGE